MTSKSGMAIFLLLTFGGVAIAGATDADGVAARTGKFLSLHYGSVKPEWMVEAAECVDMMLFSANVQVIVPQAVREANPDALCLGYLNALDFDGRRDGRNLETPGMRKEWHEINQREDWFLHDEKGERVLVYMHTGTRERYGIDRTNPELQRYLAEKAKEIVDAGYDGVFLDNFGLELLFLRKDKYSGRPAGMTNARWQEGGRALLAAIKQAVGEDKVLIYNGLHGGSSRKLSSYQTEGVPTFEAAIQMAEVCDGGMWEGYFGYGGLSLSESNLRRIVDTFVAYNKLNKVTVALASGKSEQDAKTRFCLYLLSLDGEHAYFSYVPNYKRVDWYPIFDIDIGKPAADYEMQDGIATRLFEKGFVAVNATEEKATVSLPQRYKNGLGEEVEKLTLPPKSGEILFDLSVEIELPE